MTPPAVPQESAGAGDAPDEGLPQPAPGEPPLDVAKLTWAALLGRWIDFARSALALPKDQPGQRWRQAVPDIIMLQAIWFSLQQLRELPDDERGLGLARADVLIEKHAASLEQLWQGEPLPSGLREVITDAAQLLEQVRLQQEDTEPPPDPAPAPGIETPAPAPGAASPPPQTPQQQPPPGSR